MTPLTGAQEPPATAGTALDRAGILARIPHQGRMCLLDRVLAWDVDEVRCRATSHRAADNPLRADGRLGAACGIEYAAQAMAVHGALLGEAKAGSFRQPRAGFLVAVRGVSLHVRRLDDLEADLDITATRVLGDANGIVYRFRVEAGARTLLEGRATVLLDAAALPA